MHIDNICTADNNVQVQWRAGNKWGDGITYILVKLVIFVVLSFKHIKPLGIYSMLAFSQEALHYTPISV